MKEKNKISSLTTTLGCSFIMSLALVMISNATENPFEATSLSSGYIVADGHNPTEHDQDNPTEHDQDNPTEHDQDNPTEHDQDNYKQHKCNVDKGQNCNEPSW
jgi:hypothetical protein